MSEQAAAMTPAPIECRLCHTTNLLAPNEFAVPCSGCGLLVRKPRHTITPKGKPNE
jgi:hypothetical protein